MRLRLLDRFLADYRERIPSEEALAYIDRCLVAIDPFNVTVICAALEGLTQAAHPFFDGRRRPSPTQFAAACRACSDARGARFGRRRRRRSTEVSPDVPKTREGKIAALKVMREMGYEPSWARDFEDRLKEMDAAQNVAA
jgi:hypothetical protein